MEHSLLIWPDIMRGAVNRHRAFRAGDGTTRSLPHDVAETVVECLPLIQAQWHIADPVELEGYAADLARAGGRALAEARERTPVDSEAHLGAMGAVRAEMAAILASTCLA